VHVGQQQRHRYLRSDLQVSNLVHLHGDDTRAPGRQRGA
jgi:hypothetical protein